jgi:hypothetical protein
MKPVTICPDGSVRSQASARIVIGLAVHKCSLMPSISLGQLYREGCICSKYKRIGVGINSAKDFGFLRYSRPYYA